MLTYYFVIEALDQAYEDAYAEVCELMSPNDLDFDRILDQVFERLCVERGITG